MSMMLSIIRTAIGDERGERAVSSRACGVNGRSTSARQVQRAQQARAVGRQRLFAARVGRADLLAIARDCYGG